MKTGTNKSRILNPPLLPIFSVLAIGFFIYYLVWRAVYTLNPQFYFISWMLWAAEAFGVVSYLLFTWLTRNIEPTLKWEEPALGLMVDIFIPTYNEDLDIIEATMIGCNNITYPHITYVLDDGDRPNVKKLVEQLGCTYIARPTHEHAKAGNINFALERSTGEFIVMLDTDMVPQPDYLDRTLGYFKDEKLALIQLPQEFYNQDSIQHASKTGPWHEQSLFFRVIQPGKNYSNSAFWCGSPSIVRRKALLDVGGVATETITEDIHTSIRIHSRGWKTLFVNEPLAFGIAPQTIKAFLIQRLRWAQGTMQLYRSKDCPLWVSGLTLQQRLSYLASFLAYFESFQKLILLLTPVIILTLNVVPMQIEILPFMARWIPYFALNILANQLGGRGVFNYLKTEKYNLLKTIVFIQGTLTLFFNQPLKFKVTPKTIDESVYQHERRQLIGYMVILAVITFSVLFALARLLLWRTQYVSADSFVIAFIWSIYNAFIIFLALREIFKKRHERKKYRFPVKAEGMVLDARTGKVIIDSSVIDLSITGAGLLADREIPKGSEYLDLKINPKDFSAITIPIKNFANRWISTQEKNSIGIAFTEELGPQRNRLFEFLFIHLPKADEVDLYHVIQWDPLKKFRKSTKNN